MSGNGENSEGLHLTDSIKDSREPAPIEGAIRTENKETVEMYLSKLSEREAEILRMRYGLNGHKPMTLQMAGEQMGVSRERIRQIEVKAIRKLQGFAGIKPEYRRKKRT